MKASAIIQPVLLVILGLATLGTFVVLYPFKLNEYQGGQLGALGGLGGLILALFGGGVVLLNVINTAVRRAQRRYRIISLVLLLVSVLSLCWPLILGVIVPYEQVALGRAKSTVCSPSFDELRRLYPSRVDSVSVSILLEPEYFVVGDYVVNRERHRFGKTSEPMGFLFEYYRSGDANPYSDWDSLITDLSFNMSPKALDSLYLLLRETGMCDAYVDSALHATVFTWENSLGAGTRGVIVAPAIAETSLRDVFAERTARRECGKLAALEYIAPELYYFRTAPSPL